MNLYAIYCSLVSVQQQLATSKSHSYGCNKVMCIVGVYSVKISKITNYCICVYFILSAAEALRPTTLPFLALLVLQDNHMNVVGFIDDLTSK